jgi:hypothetical protein
MLGAGPKGLKNRGKPRAQYHICQVDLAASSFRDDSPHDISEKPRNVVGACQVQIALRIAAPLQVHQCELLLGTTSSCICLDYRLLSPKCGSARNRFG